MASSHSLNNQANGSKLSRLLINKGTKAFKTAFDLMYPPATLAMKLNKNKKTLQRLRYKVIKTSQWKLLYPAPPSSPDSENFDVTLLTILFRNICGLTEPAAGWDALPPDSDTTIADNIARIKFYRNEVYGHITTTEIDDDKFEKLWEKISKALISLGIPSSELDELKEAPLSPEEDDYIQELKEWYKKEAELKEINLDTNADVKQILKKVAKLEEQLKQKSRESANMSETNTLGKCDFTGKIKSLNENFLPGTRQWLFDQLNTWFTNKDSNSRVMILTAGPGVGKSVFAAEVCKKYAEQLAACHFCQYNRTDYCNPRMIIESLASIMCDNVPGFEVKLNDLLKRRHSRETLSDAFRVFINDPLHALEDREPMLLVIDALDESEVGGKSEFLELISDEFPKLPPWIKILITTRPALPVQEKLKHFNPVQISPDDERNTEDLFKYLEKLLSPICDDNRLLQSLAVECRGSFLYAYHVQMELNRTTKQLTKENISKLYPEGICDVYKKQIERLRNQLKTLSSLEVNLKPFLEVLVAAEGPLPLSLLPKCLGLPDDTQFEVRETINEVMSSILSVYEGCLTVYHKSFIDWLISDGYKEHAFTVNSQRGHEFLWRVCGKEFIQINSLDSFSNFKPCAMTRYALRHGIAHMIRCGSKADYYWSVNVKIVHARTTIMPYGGYEREWLEIIRDSFSSLGTELLHEMNWHMGMFDRISLRFNFSPFYLQSVANRIDCKDETRSLARSLLRQSQYFWFEDLNSTELMNNLRMSRTWSKDVTCIDVSPNGELVAVGFKEGWVSILRLPDFKELHFFHTMHDYKGCLFSVWQLWSISFSPSGNRLATCDGSILVELWDVNNENLLGRLIAGGPVDCCKFSDCGLFIVASKEKMANRGTKPNDVFTVWNALTQQRVDRRNIRFVPVLSSSIISKNRRIHQNVFLSDRKKKSQLFQSVYDFHIIDVFQLPDALLVTRLLRYDFGYLHPVTGRHWCSCLFHHTNELLGLPDLSQLETVVLQLKHTMKLTFLPRCLCCSLKESRAVPIKFQKLYVVPSFAKLIVFSVGNPTLTSIQPSIVSEPYVITSCCFSPDGSFLATCANGDPLSVFIWNTKLCSIVDVLQLQLKNAAACWWSDGLLWIYGGGASLFKIPISNKEILNSSGVQEIEIDWKPSKLLTFSDVLIFIDQEKSVNVARIVNGKLQYVERFPLQGSSICAAVSPSNSVVLTACLNTFHVWKENQTLRPRWIASNTGELLRSSPMKSLGFPILYKCLITPDGTRGVFTVSSHSMCYIVVVEFVTCKIQLVNKSSTFMNEERFYAGNSYCIRIDHEGKNMVVEALTNGKVVAVWKRLPKFDINSWDLPIVSHGKNDLVAIISGRCNVQFLKIVVPG